MTLTLPKVAADFETQLASPVSASDTTCTLASVTDDDGNALANGVYAFTIDLNQSSKEYIIGTISGTSVSGITSITRQGVSSSGFARAHRRGAKVVITDWAILKRILNNLDGTTGFNSDVLLGYDADPGLTAGDTYKFATVDYVNSVAIAGGADASTSVKGITKLSTAPASATNPIAVGDNDPRLPTSDEKDALVGTSGTPSSSNKYVTSDDVSSAGASGKIVRLNGTSYPVGDGSAITGVDIKTESYTANGNINQNDSVYVTSANTVKSLYPSAQGTGTSITTAPSHNASYKALPLSTNGYYLSLSGGDREGSGASALYAQVRTINSGETDFSNGTEATVYSTGNGVNVFDVKQINTDKFMVIFQSNTGGAGAGVKVCVLTVSGTTITVGAITTIESSGLIANDVAVAKLDTDKAIIYYMKDSDSDLYSQVLTVSGTTITTNTPVLVKAGSGSWHIKAIQLSTDSSMVIYQGGTTGILYGSIITVSGTVPSVGAEQTVRNTSADYYLGLNFISSTKALLVFSEQTTPTTNQSSILTISGSTITKGSDLAIGSARITYEFGTSIIGTKYALLATYSSNTNIVLSFLNISGSTPTSISTQNLTSGDTSGIHNVTAIVKTNPWTYMVTGGGVTNSDYIVKLTVVSSARIGMAQSGISDTASGTIMLRYKTQTLSGITLTPGSIYYVDDTSQPTVNSSLTSPTLGIAISTTKILLQ